MKLAKLPRDEAESIRKKIFRLGLARKDHRIKEEDGFVLVPLKDDAEIGMLGDLGIDVTNGELAERSFYKPPFQIASEECDIPSTLKYLLPEKWERLVMC